MLIKQKSLSLPRILVFRTIGVFKDLELLSSAPDKVELFATNVLKTSNLDGSGIFLNTFPSRTYLKQHNIYVTPKMV